MVFDSLKYSFLLVSYLFLFEFGRRLVRLPAEESGARFKKTILFISSWQLLPAITALIIIPAMLSSDFLKMAPILSRYFLGFTGGILAGAGLLLYALRMREMLRRTEVGKWFVLAGTALVAYGILGGLFVPPGDFFPANRLNAGLFLSITGLPVQLFRALCAVGIAYGIVRILNIFTREIEEKIQSTLIENSPDYIAVISQKGGFISVNRAGALLHEFSGPWEMAGKDAVGTVIENKAGFQEALAKALKGENSVVEFRSTGKKGAKIWWNAGFSPVKESDGGIINVLCISRDITGYREISEQNRRNYEIQKISNEILGIALKALPLPEILTRIFINILSVPFLTLEPRGAIFLADNETRSLAMVAQHGLAVPIQRACSNLPFGRCLCGRAAISGRTVYSGDLDERHEVMYDGISHHGHYCVPIKSGAEILGVLNLYLKAGHKKNNDEIAFLEGVANLLAGIVIRKRDEVELKRSQERLIQSEKMSAVGQLAAGVAHEINNPLGIILGFAQSLVKRIKEDDPMAMPLKSIERETVRCTALVQDLLVFSRTSKIEEEQLDLNEALNGALSLIFARAKPRGVEILQEMSTDLPRIFGNKNKLQQALINLANNAIDAMPEGGTLTIGTLLSGRRPGYVEIQVRDTGHGIPKKIQTRVMEPFFTTKEAGKGTGLGLSLVYEIVKSHNGSLELESEEGKGTRFIVFLPIKT